MDPYSSLGVQKGCSDDDVKKAYRKLVMKHHPDKGGDPEKFKQIQGAYEVLSDPQKRQNFDQFGNPEGPQMGSGGFPGDIFSQMFGGGQRGPVRRSNYSHEIHISLEDAYRGISKNMKISLGKWCSNCVVKCQHCKGKGQVHIQLGPMIMQQPCPSCQGQPIRSGCSSCGGKKKVVEQVNLELKIQAGTENGTTMIGHGLGEQVQNSNEEPGDIIFNIRVQNHPELMRQGADIVWQTPISFEDSVNGKKITVPHFDGPIEINTSDWGVLDPREDYVIPKKGFLKGGNLRVQFNVIYPKGKFKLEKV